MATAGAMVIRRRVVLERELHGLAGAPPSLVTLAARTRIAQRDLEVAIQARFKAGAIVHVRSGDNASPATVLETRWGRVRVRGLASLKKYWVYAERLAEFRDL